MDAIISYLVKSGSLLLLFSLVYYLLLRKETFFRSNRFFLLCGLLLSTLLPLITFTKIVWAALQPIPAQTAEEAVTMTIPQVIQKEYLVIDWWLIISIIYFLGVLFFIAQFIIDYYLIRRALTGRAIRRNGKFRIIETTEELSPFSYFNYIVYNPAHYSEAELENILEHEKTHCREYHSLDVLFTRLCCIAFWFNPIIWLYKSQIIQNLEFIADAEANRRISDRKNYQITLLKVTARENCLAFTNHFYQSLIKKRIIMLNKKQSGRINLWKYTLVVPALVLFMLQFQIKVMAQEKPRSQPSKSLDVAIEKTFLPTDSDEKLHEDLDKLRKAYNVDVTLSGVRRNTKGSINYMVAIVKDLSNKINPLKYATSGDGQINPFRLLVQVFSDGSVNYRFEELATYNDAQKGIAATVKENGTEITEPDDSVALTENSTEHPLLIIDGKEYPSFNMEEYTFECDGYILKLSQEEGIRKYGEKAKDGVLIFNGNTVIKKRGTMIPVSQLATSEELNAKETVQSDTWDNHLFVISRKSDDKELQHYTEQLALHGLKLEISGLERNAKNEITAIKIVLTDVNNGTGGQSKWNAAANGQGIPNISLGRVNGKAAISASK